jgi:hypothetical protein
VSKRTGTVRRLSGTVVASRPPEASDSQAVGKGVSDLDAIGEIVLPRDHPKWLRDRFVVSSTTKSLRSRIKPFAIRLLGFWDHRAHRLSIEDGTIQIDDSGAYRSV